MQRLTDQQLAVKSEAFRRFYASLWDSDPRDGPQIDTSALAELGDDERAEAENILIAMIEGWGGPVIQALAEVKSVRGAIVLKDFVQKAKGEIAAEAALALWRIERWPKAQEVLLEVLSGRRKDYPEGDFDDFEAYGRARAIQALAYFPGERTHAALNRALDDPNEMVRHWAQVSLNVADSYPGPTADSVARGIRERRRRRKYDWSGYVIWFFCGAFLGGGPLFLHLAIHSADFSMVKLIGWMVICGLVGGLVWGRKHRRQWERENDGDALFEEVVRSHHD